jgi:hypothetical protein
LRKPLRVLAERVLSVQLPSGEYELCELDDIHYSLCASAEFSVILRVRELNQLRASGDLVIDGVWP